MRIDVIENSADMRKFRNGWDRVYSCDPHAQPFLSWLRLQEYLKTSRRWFILAVRERKAGAPYVAFFVSPLIGEDGSSRAGLVCDPAYEMRAIGKIAQVLKARDWTKRELADFRGSAERHDALLRGLFAAGGALDRADFDTPRRRDVGAFYMSGQHHVASGHRRQAEAAFRQVLAIRPQHLGARFALGRLLFEKASLTQAERICEALLPDAANQEPVFLLLGDIQFSLGKFDKAAASFAAIADRRPNSAQAHLKRGKALWAAARMTEAIEVFTSVGNLITDDPSQAVFRRQAQATLDRLMPSPSASPEVPSIHPAGFPLEGGPVPNAADKKGQPPSPAGFPDSMSELQLRFDEPLADALVRTKH